MKLPESVARAEMLMRGVSLEYESIEETIVIDHILSKRQVEYVKTVMPLAEKPQEVDSKLKSLLFPERYYDDIHKSVEAKKYFDKIRDYDFYVRPM